MLDGVNLFPVNPVVTSNCVKFDVVFIHGIGSNAASAWTNSKNEVWPVWLEHVVQNSRSLLLDYPAPRVFFSPSSSVSIQERAENIADYLQSVGIGKRPVVYVCHSLGGILAKEIIRASVINGKLSELAKSVCGVVFLATPHAGSHVATLTRHFGSQLTDDLACDSAYLLDLRDWFSKFAAQRDIYVASYFEARKTRSVLVVEKNSADPRVAGCSCIAIDQDHSGICKPSNMGSDIFSRIKRDVVQSIEKVNKMGNELVSLEDIVSTPILTDELHLDIIGLLSKRYLGYNPGATIMNHFGASRPVCIIVTQNPKILKEAAVLEERWPDRFRVERGLMGQFTSAKKTGTSKFRSNIKRAGKTTATSRKQPPGLLGTKVLESRGLPADRAVSFSEQDRINLCDHISDTVALNAKHKLVVTCFRENDDHTEVFTSLHSLYYSLRNVVESTINKLTVDARAPSTASKSFSRKLSGLADEYRNEQVKFCINAATDQALTKTMTINLVGSRKALNGYSATRELSVNAEVKRVDYKKDLAVLRVRASPQWRTWVIENEMHHLNVSPRKNLGDSVRSGATVSTWAAPNSDLRIVSTDNTVFFPMTDRVTKLESVMVISGGDVDAGSSGSPLMDDDGHVTGMIIGRTDTDDGPRILAVDISDSREFSDSNAIESKV
ncbi:alpha/beta fold hydrolase [Tritonibacter sp. SIMBA_163]|uniref:alpha/beta fold hydrolase n=1 Tax=Tritonibacter sp. SIMBA_163 TaxID=3080868 RepID=UPI00397FC777